MRDSLGAQLSVNLGSLSLLALLGTAAEAKTRASWRGSSAYEPRPAGGTNVRVEASEAVELRAELAVGIWYWRLGRERPKSRAVPKDVVDELLRVCINETFDGLVSPL